MAVADPLLDVRGLSVSYRRSGGGPIRAVDAVDLAVPAGAMLGLVGESGCGKSTLAQALMGVLPGNAAATAERLMLGGVDLQTLSPRARRDRLWRDLAFVPQTAMNSFDPVYRLRDAMREVLCRRGGFARRAADARAAELFRSVGLDPRRLDDFPHQFSGGMRQRAAIALALALGPRLVIADEPVTALDVIVQRQVLDSFRTLAREAGLSAIVVTHDISVVAYLCSTTAVMYAGRIVEVGPTEAVLRAPSHPYTMGLMNASPDLDDAEGDLVPIRGTPPNLAALPLGCRFAPRCPFTLPACREAEPVAATVAPDHSVACWRSGEADGLRPRARMAGTWLA